MEAYKFIEITSENRALWLQPVAQFWIQLGALPPEVSPDERYQQVLFVMLREEKVVGVSTVFPKQVQHLHVNMYAFRCLIAPDHRKHHLASEALKRTYELLNKRFQSGVKPEIKGVVAIVENHIINEKRKQLIWPYTEFYLVGMTEGGHQMRARYFEGATLE